MKNRFILGIAAAVTFTSAAFGSSHENNLDPYLQGLTLAAKQGDGWSQYALGSMYYDGRGFSQDYSKALYWFRAAAESGYHSAEAKLGDMYYDGRGVPQDYDAASSWYRKGAERGSAESQAALG